MHIRHAAPSRPNIRSADQALAAEREHLRPGKRSPLPAFAALCLSGGGIRSAAFSLGVLQALAGRRLLTEFDYLSTVSGGGFIGGWLQVLIHRKGARGAEDTLRDPQAPELVELRSYTNYLTPQAGPFTGDTWTAVALYLRNLLLNWLVIVPVLLSAVLALIAHRTAVATFGRPEFWPSLMLVLTMALLFAAAMQACMLLPSHRADSPAPDPQRYASPDKIQRWIVYPTLGWSLLMPVALHPLLADAGWPAMAMLPGCYFVCMLAAYGCAWARQRRSPAVSELFRINTGAWIAATVLATAALWLAECWYVNLDLYPDDQAQALTTFAPLVLTLCHMLHAVIYVGLRKERMFSDLDREWIARLDGPILLYAFIWTAACLCCLELSAQLIPVGMRPFGTGTTWAVAITTVLTGPGVAWLGKQTLSRVEKGITGASGRQVSLRRLLDGFAAVFAVGLFAFFGVALQFLLGVVQQALGLDRLGDGVSVFLRLLGLQLLVGALLRGVSYGFSRVNVNRFSMHGVYRNRLSRAFLGTALENRRPDPFTGFGPLENPRLADFAAQPGEPRLFPVINIALNLTRSNHTAWAERKAASFTATPLACGSAELCPNQSGSSGAFVRTPDFAGATSRFDREGGRLGIRLGTALAISGAAVSPNWGYNSSALTAFLMTMFNVRLGAWLPNPAVSTEDELRLASPSNSHAAIFDELRGVATDRRQSMYLSDGGHFENLGLYEMLRRQCSRLLVVDAGQDRGCAFADLGNAIRKAAIDGLAEVTMQPIRILSRSVLEAKRRDPGPPLGLAVGTVRYPGGQTGQLVYLKPTYLPAIPAEIRAYGAAHPEFPHESTAEQWFTESQFETYRALGEWQMAELLRHIPQDAADPFASLFEQAQTIAAPPPSCPSIREVPKTGPGVFMRYTALALLALIGCTGLAGAQPLDEARRAGRTAASLPHAGEDYFRGMDNGIALTPDEVRGRNMWLVWTGGNDRFWDGMTRSTFGAFDLLKIVSSHPSQKAGRDSRWNWLGVINEPCYEQPTGPDPARFGLWLDRRSPGCPADPFADAAKYPGIATGARGVTVPAGSYYGEPTGIVGLRLFPNPAFNEAARQHWDAERYYTDKSYYDDPTLVRPYRVGMSCGFCHVGPSPIHPPADPAHPQWSELNSTVGAQYLWVDRLFVYSADPSNFMFQLVHTYRPGAMDTSLVSTDNINNPRTMNAIYGLGPRLGQALRWGQETITGPERNNRQLNDFVATGPLTQFFQPPGTVLTPHVLKDGSDSVGALGALNRVYLNIGLYSEEWLRHFNPVVGGTPITPIRIATAQARSSYWQATERGTPDMARFFLRAGQPDRLADAPGGGAYLDADAALLDHGKTVFAETCARCHSSKLPDPPAGASLQGCAGPGYLACWNRYWAWTHTDEFKAKMQSIVAAPDFLDGNYLSTDARVPVTLLQTNACSPLATNALAGNIWNDFSSDSYKSLPSVGTITVHDPFTGQPRPYVMPAGGRGYTRPPSLISVWSTAPFLLNNSLGPYEHDPSVAARMRVFQASIEQLLWPERRDKDTLLGDKVPGVIDRTTERSFVILPDGYIPAPLRALRPVVPGLFDADGGISLGPIPAGVPVNLLSNLQPLAEDGDVAAHYLQLARLLLRLKLDLLLLPPDATDAHLRDKLANLAAPLLALNKCPDFVVNRGHYFGATLQPGEPALSDADKNALIAFLKTF